MESPRRMLGSVFRSKGDVLQKEINRLNESLQSLIRASSISKTDEWARIKRAAMAQSELLKETIIALSSDPIKNEKNLMRCRFFNDAILLLFDIVEIPVDEIKAIQKRLRKTIDFQTEITGLPKASEVETTLR